MVIELSMGLNGNVIDDKIKSNQDSKTKTKNKYKDMIFFENTNHKKITAYRT